jgi:hypothetical protein
MAEQRALLMALEERHGMLFATLWLPIGPDGIRIQIPWTGEPVAIDPRDPRVVNFVAGAPELGRGGRETHG